MGGTPGGPGVEPESPAQVITQSHVQRQPKPVAEARDYRAAFAIARAAMALLDPDGSVLAANGALGRLLGTSPERMMTEGLGALLGASGDRPADAGARRRAGRPPAQAALHPAATRPDGSRTKARLTLTRTDTRPLLLTVEDIGEHEALRQELRHLRMHDPVTRLPNRALFFERLTDACARAPGQGTGRIGLCYLDLDGFKAVNDTLGHRVGDELLAAVAGRLLACAEPAAAPGGPARRRRVRAAAAGTPPAPGRPPSWPTAVLTALQQPFDVAGQRLAVSASIGVVERDAAGTSATGLMQAADTTLYWAKADGKGRWTLFDPERNEHRMTRQALSRTLRQAVERGEFVLDYQPLVALDTGELRGVEALVRWEHPHFGRLAPNRFIGLAEEDGSIVQLGRWVLAESCRQARAWQRDVPGTAAGGQRQHRGAADVGLRPGRRRGGDPAPRPGCRRGCCNWS